MSTPLVVAFLGDRDSSAQLSQLVQSSPATVVAVALDLGDGQSLAELKAAALAAGAARCHALDVRDAFVRAAMLPASRKRTAGERSEAFAGLSAAFVAHTVRGIAEIENGRYEAAERVGGRTRIVRPPLTGPVTMALTVEGGEPVALNHIAMTPSELVDSLETIAGMPAIDVLHQVFRELDGADAGQVVLRAHDGACTVQSAVTV